MTIGELPASRRLGRPKDCVSTETRARLLRGARRAFARNGYDATTNREIADAAGLTSGAIYHYYPSKADLYAAVFDDVQATLFGAFEAALAAHDTILSRFNAALDVVVAMNRADPSIAGFVIGTAGELRRHPELGEQLAPLRSLDTKLVRRLVRDATDRGELADDIDPSAVEDLLYVVLSGLTRLGNQSGDAERQARAIDALKRFLAGTLVAR